jgi:hypothetical protein
MNQHRLGLFGLIAISATVLLAADAPWKTKPAAQWSEEDAKQVLAASPWAREIRVGISRRLSEDELRDGGQMGQPKGVGYDGVDGPGSGPRLPKTIPGLLFGSTPPSARSQVQGTYVRLRWESALPVRIAELKAGEVDPPTLPGDGYRIAVYGVPGGYLKGDPKKLGKPLKDGAVLKREGKNDVKPTSVEAFELSDGWAVVYLFPFSAEISPKDGQVEFDAQIGRVIVVQPFDLATMFFQGKLEL